MDYQGYCTKKYLAMALVMNANNTKYDSLLNQLENYLLVSQDLYPTTMRRATHLLTNWKVNTNTNNQNCHGGVGGGGFNGGGSDGPVISFAQTQVPIPANKDFSKLQGYENTWPCCAPSCKPPHHISDHITCTCCKIKGYYVTVCPFITNAAQQLFQSARLAVQLRQTTNVQLSDPH